MLCLRASPGQPSVAGLASHRAVGCRRLPGPGVGRLRVGAPNPTLARSLPHLPAGGPFPETSPLPFLASVSSSVISGQQAPGLICHIVSARRGVLDTQGPPAKTLQVFWLSGAEGSQNMISAASAILGDSGEATSPSKRFSSQLPRFSNHDQGVEGGCSAPL